MPVMLYKLNGVPDDEANELRVLLDENGIDYYETSAGNWRISMAAIWLKNKDQYQQAKDILAAYQADREESARLQFKHLKAEGKIQSFMARVLQEPVRYSLYFLVITVVLYFSIIPFFYFTQWLGGS